MPNPLERFRHCSQAEHQDALDEAERDAFEAQQAFQGFTYNMPREAPLTTPEWQEYNRVYNDFLNKSEKRDRAFLAKQLCETRYTIPPRRPMPDPPKS
ncbi:MAG: hypothetical protein ACAI38_16205 [Myxococcota bacterium]